MSDIPNMVAHTGATDRDWVAEYDERYENRSATMKRHMRWGMALDQLDAEFDGIELPEDPQWFKMRMRDVIEAAIQYTKELD